ncbi:DUF742 domain-containing protein [Saccharomonospora xinjiangensis]|uniref:DUF742 domain-containing protein n=1 Tax=Saccharomonospora xinjiangensis TaxID=75294 RepID=UPI0010C46933|nr:DUF742 domain-containing protein [Saccharomonospora xinjiangensis]QBQ62614.1 hypothetical protein EYD13_21430 [Saccharomonospora xinjiangensis]
MRPDGGGDESLYDGVPGPPDDFDDLDADFGSAFDTGSPADAPSTSEGWRPSPAPRRPRPERVVMSARDAFASDDDSPSVGRLRARPYVLTKGRTRARRDLAVETLVSAEPHARWHLHKPGSEYRKLGQLCTQPLSVAEIAANLSVPLGVARVLISDLAETGFVKVHAMQSNPSGRPDRLLLDRVLEGLRRL